MEKKRKYKPLITFLLLVLIFIPAQTFGQFGNALDFDGGDDNISFPFILDPSTSDFTVEMWFKCIQPVGGNADVLINQADGTGQGRTWLRILAGSGFISSALGVTTTNGTTELVANQWYHVALTLQGTTLKLYINGNQEASTSRTPEACDGSMFIGKHSTLGNNFGGTIDEFRFWNIARTQAEIQNDINSYITSSHSQWNNLITYYRLDQGSAGSGNGAQPNEVIDYSENKKDGSLNGFSLSGNTSNWVFASNAAPILTTTDVPSVSANSAQIEMNIFSNGLDASVSKIGAVWSTSPSPLLSDNTMSKSGASGPGTENITITGLSLGQTYYVRATASNSEETSYGETQPFTTAALQLCGNYTIGDVTEDFPGGTNFDTFTDAVEALIANGVSCATTFNVISGNYDEQISISSIPGASAVNTITFQSQSGNYNDVILSNAPATNNWIVRFNGADYIRFQNMTISNTNSDGSSRGTVLLFDSNNEDIIVNMCVLNGISTNSDLVSYSVVYNSSGTVNNIILNDNIISYGSRSIYFWGSSYVTKNQFTGNVLNDYAYFGFSLKYQDGVILKWNELTGAGVRTLEYGIYLSYCDGNIQIQKNKIISNATSANYGIYFTNCLGSTGNVIEISNNFITSQGNTGNAFGMDINSSEYVNIYYNSVNIVSGANVANYALDVDASAGGNINIKNNILSNRSTQGCALQLVTTGISSCDFNDLYTTGSNFVKADATPYYDLAEWQGSAFGFDANSISVNPLFTSDADLHAKSACLDGAATPVGILDDIDALNVRDGTNPDIGADEFNSVALSGTYTIGSGGDFASFSDAIDALVCNGISTAVTFDVITGTYNEQISIPAITGSSAANTITFQSQSGTITDVILENAPVTDNWVLRFDACSNVTFQNMTIENKSSTAEIGRVISFNQGTEYITINNNVLKGRNIDDPDNPEESYAVIWYNYGSTTPIIDNIFITDNLIEWGSYGIKIYIDWNTPGSNYLIEGNTIQNYYNTGIKTYQMDGLIVKNNIITAKGVHTFEDGINCYASNNNSEISYNIVSTNWRGIETSYGGGSPGDHFLISNNIIHINGTNNAPAIRDWDGDYSDIYNNTIYLENCGTTSSGIEIYSTGIKNHDIKNNIIVNLSQGYCLNFTDLAHMANVSIDNNCYYYAGTAIAAYDANNITSYNTLADWQTASTKEVESFVENPPFIAAPTNLHINNSTPTLIESGGSAISLLDDIDGDIRFGETGYTGTGTAKDIGADEGEFTAFQDPENALDFDGTDDYVDIPFIMDPAADVFTVECWFKVTEPAGTDDIIISQTNGTGTGRAWLKVGATSQKLESFLGGITLASINSLVASQWYHAALTFDGTDLILYLDGVIQSANTPTMEACDGNTILGSFGGAAPWFLGEIDELRIWSTVRTSDEIRENMCMSLSTIPANLLAYYDFNKASGTSLPDLTGNSYDGTLNSMDNTDWVNSGAFTTWTGDINATDWWDDSNWTNGSPDGTPSSNAGIPDVVNDPQLNSTQFTNHLVIGTGSGLSIINNGMNLQATGNAFSFSPASGDGAIEMATGTTLHFVAGNFSRIEINENTNEIGLASNVYISSDLVLTSGIINIFDYDMQLLSGATISGTPGNTNYIIAEHAGSLIQEVVSGSKLYPIGSDSEYYPVTLNDNTGTPDNYRLRLYPDVTIDGVEGSTQIAEINNVVKITWLIEEETAGGADLDITLQWNGTAPPEGVSFDRTNCGIGHYTDGAWEPQVASSTAGGPSEYNRSISVTGTLGAFSVGDINSPMAISVYPIGNALDFDGIDDFVQIPYIFDPGAINFTAECFFMVESLAPADQILITQKNGTGTGNKWLHVESNGKLRTYLDGTTPLISVSSINPGQWYHAALTYDGTNLSMYLNGSLEVSENRTVVSATGEMILGSNKANNDKFLNGVLDEVRLWNRARSASEISSDIFTQYEPDDEPNLVGYWRMDQGRNALDNTDLPNEVIDYSGQCNTGTLNGFSLTTGTGNWVSTNNDGAPILTTSSVNNVNYTSADIEFEIFDTGASTDGGYGLCWSVNPCPTIDVNTVTTNTTISNIVYTENLTCLSPNTTYYARAFAWNLENLSYGETRSFTTNTIAGYDNIWTGCESIDWFNPANWSSNSIPTSTEIIFIPEGTPFQPTIPASSPTFNPGNSDAECKTITINASGGAKLTIEAGKTLKTN